MNKKYWNGLLLHSWELCIAFIVSLIAATNLFDEVDYRVSDGIYQNHGEVNSDIIVIGIDSETLNKLGPPLSWLRRDMPKVITYLNEHDPQARPAVIGLDILFTGENSQAPEIDKQLVETVARYDNIVVASDVDETDSSDDPYARWNKAWPLDPPFAALTAVVDTGHICFPFDADGLIRHQLLYVNTTEHGQLYSFARIIYEKYCHYKGIAPKPIPMTESNGIYYLPFTAKSYSKGINFIDLLEGKVNPEVYRDKIVLIGPYASGLGDAYLTPLDWSSTIYGVDIHANAIQAFQRGFLPREAEQIWQIIILFFVSFISTLFFKSSRLSIMLMTWLIICLGWLGICKICYHNEIILHALWEPLAVSVLFICMVSFKYIHTRAERDMVTSTFGRYVDPTIMNQLLESDAVDVGGSLKNIAVLFVDIRGFTTMSEELPPPVVVEILNKYLTLTTECIRRHHGTLDKFVGDCTMAFWNAPLPQKEPVLLACRAAIDMIKDSAELRAEIKALYGKEIAFGVGVHWGSAVVGNIGSPFRMDYTAIGDTVNTAARLESNAPGGKIYISRDVADILGKRANVTSLGNSVKLKGKADGFEVLTLDSLNETEEV